MVISPRSAPPLPNMTDLQGARILDHRRCGVRGLPHRRSAHRRRGRPRGRVVRQPPARLPAQRGGRPALGAGPPRRGRHPRPRAAWTSSMAGVDVRLPQAAMRITQCAENPRLALEVLSTAPSTSSRPRRAPRSGRWSRRRRRRCYGIADASRPAKATIPTTTARSTARPRRSTRGCCRSLQRHVRARRTSRCGTSTSTARAWTSYGAYTEVLDPLDGAHRRRASRR